MEAREVLFDSTDTARTDTSHVFLDIACIQQDDEESKAQGIEQLGAVTEDRLRTLFLQR